MKRLSILLLVTSLMFMSCRVVDAAIIRVWTEQELLEKSDLVVIATPTATRDTQERGPLPGDERQLVVGVQTDFAVTSVLKGPQATKTLVLHHYRYDGVWVANGPMFVAFDPKDTKSYRLYLVRQEAGFYVPASGQQHPEFSLRSEPAK